MHITFQVHPKSPPVQLADYNCSFCLKGRHQVIALVSGPCGNICSECAEVAVRIINEYETTLPSDDAEPAAEPSAALGEGE